MKKALLLLILSLSFTTSYSQKSNLVFFAEQGERFTLILNGIRQNMTPETNVKVTDLVSPSYKMKIIFEDKKIPDVDKTLVFNQGTETTFNIKKNNKGAFVVRWMNEVPVEQALPPAQGQTVMVYNTVPPPATTTVTHTQSTTTVSSPPATSNQGGGASMGININDPASGVSFNVNMNAGGPGLNSASTATTSTTITTTTTTGSSEMPPPPAHAQAAYVLQGYNGPVGCSYPMSPGDFNAVKQSIASKTFEDSKLTIAKQVISTNCLLSSQVKEIMLLFTFEETRLELAKYAYGFTYDTGNYYRLNDAFTFESSIEELNQYISSRR